MGDLIRVLPGIYDTPPNLQVLSELESNFWTFFSLPHAMKDGTIQRETNCRIPDHSQKMPIFRNGTVDPETGIVETWWLWDGERSWKVGTISEDQRILPILGAWNATMLVDRIEQGWLPERDPR